MRVLRFLRIVHTIGTYGLDEFLPRRGAGGLRLALRTAYFRRDTTQPRGERLRLALESLGPVFVKFGQLLSVRRDLIPEDIADELAKLQDAVPPFAWEEVAATLSSAYGRPWSQVFDTFDQVPIASASVAQVHFARLPDGREVAVKILRPGIREVILQDVALLYGVARIIERTWSDGRRLRAREVVAEYENILANELDLLREAGNASQLRPTSRRGGFPPTRASGSGRRSCARCASRSSIARSRKSISASSSCACSRPGGASASRCSRSSPCS